MNTLYSIQKLQLRLIESAYVNEMCADDLLTILHVLNSVDAKRLVHIVDLLQRESESLRRISKDITLLDRSVFPSCLYSSE